MLLDLEVLDPRCLDDCFIKMPRDRLLRGVCFKCVFKSVKQGLQAGELGSEFQPGWPCVGGTQAWRSLVSGRSDDGSLRPEEDVYASQ